MITQLMIGSLLTFASILVAGLSWWLLETFMARMHYWAMRPPHGPKLFAVLTFSLVMTLLMVTSAVWIWAVAFYFLGIFGAFEASVYFSLVAITTLGFGDILLPQEWRLLGGLAAANGLLMFGVLTAMLVEVLRNTRQGQRSGRGR